MELSNRGRLMVVLAAAAVVLAAGIMLSVAARPVQAVSPVAPSAVYTCTPAAVAVFDTASM